MWASSVVRSFFFSSRRRHTRCSRDWSSDVCSSDLGHYKDVDQRVADGLGAEEVSIGDFVLSGGEPAALGVVDAVVRLLPGALGDHESASSDSHYEGLLAPPSYTRPPSYRGLDVPDVLLSGDHDKIAAWRAAQAERLTRERRPDIWLKHGE